MEDCESSTTTTGSKDLKIRRMFLRRNCKGILTVLLLLTVVILTGLLVSVHNKLRDTKRRLYAAQRAMNLLTPKYSACEITDEPPNTLPYYATYKNDIKNYTGDDARREDDDGRRLEWESNSWRTTWGRQQGSTTIEWEILK